MPTLTVAIDASGAQRGASNYVNAVQSIVNVTNRYGNTVNRSVARNNILVRSFTRLGRTIRNVSGMLVSIRTLLVTGIFAVGVREVMEYADAWTNVKNRIDGFLSQEQKLAGLGDTLRKKLFDVAQESRVAVRGVTTLFSRLFFNRDTIGLSVDEILRFVELTSKAVTLSGSTSTEARGAIIQFSQLLASGQIRAAGQELQAIREQTPALFGEILNGLNITEGAFRAAAEAGELTSRELALGLINNADSIESKFANLTITIGQAFTRLDNSIQRAIGTFFEKSGLGSRIVNFIVGFSKTIDDLTTILGDADTLISKTIGVSGGGLVLDAITGGDALDEILKNGAKEFGKGLLEIISSIPGFLIGRLIEEVASINFSSLLSGFVDLAEAAAYRFVMVLEENIPLIKFGRSDSNPEPITAQSASRSIQQAIRGFGSRLSSSSGERIEFSWNRISNAVLGVQSDIAGVAQQIEYANNQTLDFDESVDEVQKKFAQLSDFLEPLAERLTRMFKDFGDSVSSSFEQAIFSGESLRDVLQGLAEDIARIAFRQMVGSVIGAGVSTLFSRIPGLPQLNVPSLQNAQGNMFKDGRVIPFAQGGYIDRTTIFPMRGGAIGVAGEAGREVAMPTRMSNGDMGVAVRRPQTTVVINNNISTPNADSFRRSERQLGDRMRRQAGF